MRGSARYPKHAIRSTFRALCVPIAPNVMPEKVRNSLPPGIFRYPRRSGNHARRTTSAHLAERRPRQRRAVRPSCSACPSAVSPWGPHRQARNTLSSLRLVRAWFAYRASRPVTHRSPTTPVTRPAPRSFVVGHAGRLALPVCSHLAKPFWCLSSNRTLIPAPGIRRRAR